jgi:O-antigen/teichoic acid export membrane protein
MASEVRRNLLRIAMNYARLLLTLCLGIVFVRLILRSVGNDGFGLIGLLGSASGITSMVQMVVQRSMIRELGRAHHANDGQEFVGTYNSAIVLTWLAAGASCLLFLAMYLLLPWFRIPDNLLWAARWFVIAAAAQTAVVIALGAPMNMYLVKERMVAFNFWRTVERACFVAAAVYITYGNLDEDIGQRIVIYGFVTAALIAATHLSATTLIVLSDRRLVPHLGATNRPHLKAILGVGGWNAGVVASLNLHHHADNIIMNQAFGLFGSAVFTIAMRLTGYVRMLTTGMTVGLDAVSARVSSDDESGNRLARLIYHSTRMHGLAAIPAVLAMCLLAEPMLRLWIGSTVQDPDTTIPAAIIVTWALALGIAVHSIADGWITVLYGAGHIHRYGPLIIIGGIANPIVAVVLLLTLPDNLRLIAPALGYSSIMLVMHFILLPITTAKIVGTRLIDVYAPLARPALAAVIASPVLIAPLWLAVAWSLPILLAVLAGYGTVFAAVSYAVVLTRDERRRITQAVGRRISR